MRILQYGEDSCDVIFEGVEFSNVSRLFELGLELARKNEDPEYTRLRELTEEYRDLFKD